MSSIFRKDVSSTGNWFKNIAKSTSAVSKTIIKEMVPTTYNIGRSLKQNASDITTMLKGTNRTNMDLDKLSAQSIRDAIRDAKEMIKSGDFTDDFTPSSQRNSDMSFGSSYLDDMMDSIEVVDDNGFSDSDNEKITSSIVSASNKAAENIGNQTAILSNVIASTSKTNSAIAIKQIEAVRDIGVEVSRGLQSINDNISMLVKFQSENMSSYISASYKFYEDMIQLTKTNTSLYAVNNQSKHTTSNTRNLLDFSNNLDINKYIKMIKTKTMKSAPSADLLSTLFQSIKMVGPSALLQSVITDTFKDMVKGFLPKSLRENVKRADSLLGASLPTLIMKMGFEGKKGTAFTNKLMEFFGDNIKPKAKIDVTKSAQKGAIPFDAETKGSISASLVYLRKILSAITGEDEMVYDYKTNTFKSMQSVKKKYNENLVNNSLDFNALSTINKLSYSLSKSGANLESVNKSMEGMKKYIYSLVNQDSMPDVKNANSIYKGMKNAQTGLDDRTIRQIANMLDSLNKTDKIKLFGSGVMKGKYNLNSYMEELEMDPGVYAELFNGANKFGKRRNSVNIIPKGQSSAELNVGSNNITRDSSTPNKDKYGYTTNDYLRDLKYLLLKGIRVFPNYRHLQSGGGDNDPTAHIDAMLRAMGEDVNSSKATQADFNVLASASQTNIKKQNSLDRMDDDLYDAELNEERQKQLEKMLESQKKREDKDSKKGFLGNLISSLASRSGLNRIGPFRKLSQFARITGDITKTSIDNFENIVFKGLFGLEDGDENLFKQTGDEIKGTFNKFKDAFITSISPETKVNEDREGFGKTFKGIFSSISDGVINFNRELFGLEKKNKSEITFKEFGKSLREKAPSVMAGSVIGTASSLLGGSLGLLPSLFLPGGPIGAAILGGTVGFISKSDSFKNFLFGPKDINGKRMGGLITKDFQDRMRKKKNSIVLGSALGAANSFILGNGFLGSMLLGSGPIGGAILGTGVAIAASGETFKKFLFGEMGEDGKRDKTAGLIGKINGVFSSVVNKVTGDDKGHRHDFGKITGGAITGALASSIIGNMGLLGGLVTFGGSPIMGALAGAAAGITLSSKRWSEAMFGKVGEDGKRKGGKAGQLKHWFDTSVAEPLALKIEEYKLASSEWFTKNFAQPLKVAFDPLVQSINMATQTIGQSFKNLGSKILGFFTGEKEGIMKRSLKGLGWLLGGPIFGKGISNWIDNAIPDKKSKRGGMFTRIGRFGLGAIDKGIRTSASVVGGLATLPFKGAAGMINMINKNAANKEYKEQLKARRKAGEIGFWDYIDQKYDSEARSQYFMDTRGYDPNYYKNIDLDENQKKDFAARKARLAKQKEQLKLKQEFARQRGYKDFDEAGKDISWMYDKDIEYKKDSSGNITAVKSSPIDEAARRNHETVTNIFTETKDIREILTNIFDEIKGSSVNRDEYRNKYTNFKVPYNSSDFAMGGVDKYFDQIMRSTDPKKAKDEMAASSLKYDDMLMSSTVNTDRIIAAINSSGSAIVSQAIEEDIEDDKHLNLLNGRDEDGKLLPAARTKRDIDYINAQRAEDTKNNKFLAALNKLGIGGIGSGSGTGDSKKEDSWWSWLSWLLPVGLLTGGLMLGNGEIGQSIKKKLSEITGNTIKDMFGFGKKDDNTEKMTLNEAGNNIAQAGVAKAGSIGVGLTGKFIGKAGNLLVKGGNLFNNSIAAGAGTVLNGASTALAGASSFASGYGTYKLLETGVGLTEDSSRYLYDENGNPVSYIENAGTTEALGNAKRHLMFRKPIKTAAKVASSLTKSTVVKEAAQESAEEILQIAAKDTAKSTAKAAGGGFLKKTVREWFDKALKLLPKFFENETVKKVLGSKVVKAAKECFEKYFKEAVQKILTSDTLLGKAAKSIGKKLGKVGLSAATLFISDAAFAAWDLITGATKKETADMFKIRKEDVTIGMRTVSGLLKALFGFSYLFILDIAFEILAEATGVDVKMIIARQIYTFFSSSSMEEVEQLGENFKSDLEAYNQANGTDLSLGTYSDLVNLNKKVAIDSGKGNSEGQADALSKAATSRSNSITTAAKENKEFVSSVTSSSKSSSGGKGSSSTTVKGGAKKDKDGKIIGFGKGGKAGTLNIQSASSALLNTVRGTSTSTSTNGTSKNSSPFVGTMPSLMPSTKNNFAYFSQKDGRWAGTEYRPSAGGHFKDPTMAQRGCGPTAMAMVIKQLGSKQDITPVEAAEYSTKHGYSIESGTAYGFFPAMAKDYGLRTESVKVTQAQATKISKNTPMIISASGGAFSNGHYVVAVDKGKNGIIINDPLSPDRSTEYRYKDILPYAKAGWFITPASNKVTTSAIGNGYMTSYDESTAESSEFSDSTTSDTTTTSSNPMSFLDKVVAAADAITEAVITGKPLDMSWLHGTDSSSTSSDSSYESSGDGDIGTWNGETPYNPSAGNKDYSGLDAAIINAAGNATNFMKAIYPAAKDTYAAYGVYPSVTLAQASCESANGTSKVAKSDKNLFGIKYHGDNQKLPPGMVVTRGLSAPSSEGSAPYRRYRSYGDSIIDHGFFLRNNSRYPNAGVFKAENGRAQVRAISNAGYATSSYGDTLINGWYNTMNLDQYDQYIMDARKNGGSTSSGSSSNVKAGNYSSGVVTPSNPTIRKAFNAAQELVNKNVPYVYGGTYPSSGGTDCSGLMQYAYKQAGVNISRTTYTQIHDGQNVPLAGALGNDNAQPGDLLFPHTGHVYMYAGNGKAYEAMKTGTNIMVSDSPSRRKSIAIRRIVTGGKGEEGGGKGIEDFSLFGTPINIKKHKKIKPSNYINGKGELKTSEKDGGFGGGKGISSTPIAKYTPNTNTRKIVNAVRHTSNTSQGNTSASINTTLIANNTQPTLQKSYNVYNSNETTVNSLLSAVVQLLTSIDSNTGETVTAINNIVIPEPTEVSTNGENSSITNNIFTNQNQGSGSGYMGLPKSSQNAVIGRTTLMQRATQIAKGGLM